MRTAARARRCYAAGYIPSLRTQAEFARGFDRYIEQARAYPEERFCEACERPLVSLERLCDECTADSR